MILDIIFEDSDILVVRKPAGIESQGGKSLAMDMVSLIKNEFVFRQRKAGKQLMTEPYVGVVHRLDRPVSGVMVYAKTPMAAAELSKQVQQHKMEKRYYALLCAMPAKQKGSLVDYLIQDSQKNMSYVQNEKPNQNGKLDQNSNNKKKNKTAKKAVLEYEIVQPERFHGFDLIYQMEKMQPLYMADIRLITGRHHQIRVQFANADCPIWGDTKYNPKWRGKKGIGQIGLCAYELTFWHPISGEKMVFHY